MADFNDLEACVDAVIDKVGRDIRLATPLGAGKPNHLLNAIYRRAKRDASIQLTVMTALTLGRPKGKSELEKRFLEPFVARVYGNYPDLDYEADRLVDQLPENVRVIEFYFAPGKYLGVASAQRDYVCSNYTHAVRDILDRGVNVLFQQVAFEEVDGQPMLSLSCNSDVTLELIAGMRLAEERGIPIALVAQTNSELPFMYGDAALPPTEFHFLLRNPELDYTVFGLPKMSVSDADFMIGLYCSALIKDGGELQVGIGAVGDAVVHALLLRQDNNEVYRQVLDALELTQRFPVEFERLGGAAPFEKGLLAASEMVIDGFLHLFKRGVIARKVFDDANLQRLLNQGRIDEHVTPCTVDALLACGAINTELTQSDVEYLVYYGVFRQGVSWADGEIAACDGLRFSANLGQVENRARLVSHCLGDRLRHGAVIHGAFFLGNQAFYQALRSLPREDRELIQMRSVARINQLYGHEEIDRLHRRDARFINTCMMITLSGAAVSDGLETGDVVSGVGGQYNFVVMAQELPDGHSILNMRATRQSKGKVVSNVVWNYGHTTIPRHLRDVYVTEYGIAFVRGKTDEEIIKAILNVCDSRFQHSLMAQAKAAGKLDGDYQIPRAFRNNYPETIVRRLAPFKKAGLFPAFPLGCDFTEEELAIGKALRALKFKAATTGGLVHALAAAVVRGRSAPGLSPLLTRMGLDSPSGIREHVYRRLLCAELKASMST